MCLVSANASEQQQLIREFHEGGDGGHAGRGKTPGKVHIQPLHATVNKINSCGPCSLYVYHVLKLPLFLRYIQVLRFQRLHKATVTYIVTVVDCYSWWPEAAPLKERTAVGIADFLFALFCHHGVPHTIFSNQGREFVNDVTSRGFPINLP